MLALESSAFLLAGGWASAAIMVGMICGFFIGRWFTLRNEPDRLKTDREQTLEALATLLSSTKQLNDDVDTHNEELCSARTELETMSDSGADSLQDRLISNISRVVTANRRLENDLVVSRYKLEAQAQEIDRSRVEARTDGLCSTGNRKAFDESLQFMVSKHHKNEDQPFGLMLIDIDHFKRINDTFGHVAGDNVLSSIGQALKQCIRPGDIVCRIGGDEFALILDGIQDDTAHAVGSRIRSTVERFNFSVGQNEQTTVVTMSMGLAVASRDDDVEAIYCRADKALYKSKEQGRNRLSMLWSNGKMPSISAVEKPAPATIDSYEQFKLTMLEGMESTS